MDRVVDEMEQLPVVAECCEMWWDLQCQVYDFYSDQERRRPPLSRQKEFRMIKNSVIREAELIRSGAVTFEDEDLKPEDKQKDDSCGSADYRYLKSVICDESRSLKERDKAVEDLHDMAENGDLHAQHLMGKIYRDGPLLIPDAVHARDRFTRAAEQNLPAAESGNSYAQCVLGKLYLKGEDVPKDEATEVYWLTESANQRNNYAWHLLNHPEQSLFVLSSVTRLL